MICIIVIHCIARPVFPIIWFWFWFRFRLIELCRPYFQVFDGHGGVDAASFAKDNMLKSIVEDAHFPAAIRRAIRNAFVRTDHAISDNKSLDRTSGTTALIALVLGR